MRIAVEKGVSVLMTVIHYGTLNNQMTCRIAFSGLEFKEGI